MAKTRIKRAKARARALRLENSYLRALLAQRPVVVSVGGGVESWGTLEIDPKEFLKRRAHEPLTITITHEGGAQMRMRAVPDFGHLPWLDPAKEAAAEGLALAERLAAEVRACEVA